MKNKKVTVTDTWQLENAKLKKELVQKTRELEIEAALERVRSRTMGMLRSEELQETAVLMFQQVIGLDVPAFGYGFNIWDKDRKFATAWMGGQNRMQPPFKTSSSEDIFQRIYEASQNGEALFVEEQKGEALKAHYTYMCSNPIFKEIADKMAREGQSFPTFQIMHCAFFPQGYLMFITFEPVPEAHDIFKRFAKVFEQTYTRFLDLQKAEAQAREAEIQLALERVRARTMAMHKSSELAEVAALLFQQFKSLGIETFSSGFNIWNSDHKNLTSWMSNASGSISPPFELPIQEYEQHKSIFAAWKNHESFMQDDIVGENLIKHYQFLRSFPLLDESFKIAGKAGVKIPERQVHNIVFFTHGYLLFITLEPCPQFHNIFKRFGKVFDQTYTRFLDLQIAEAQAREAQIEAALERVRARTMAMQKSEELADAAFVLFEQLRALGGNLWGTGFGLCEENAEKDEFWFANENGVLPPVAIPNTTDPAHKQMYQGWQKKTDFLSIEKSGTALKSHYDYMLSLPKVRPFFQKIIDEGLSFPKKQQWNAAYFSKGYLLIITLEPYPKPEIFKRFAKVFEQTYTRFLDLKKAEAQARESQIQLALERVRARTMAMQSSDELAEVSYLLNKQVVDLGIPTRGCAFNIYNEHDSTEWFSNLEGTLPAYKTPRENIFLKYYEAGQRGETLWIEEFGKERIKQHYDYLHSLRILGDDEEVIEKLRQVDFQIDHVAYFKYGYLLFITLVPAPEAHEVFKRFAKEFEQTYTRFLDLKKAEAQAREAKIEMALEKVRSRTMAMQKSEELSLAANNLFLQVQELGIPAWSAGYCIWQDDKHSARCNMSSEGEIQKGFILPSIGEGYDFYTPQKNGEHFHVKELGGEALVKHYDFMKQLPNMGEILKELTEAGLKLPTFQIFHIVYFKFGYVMFITYQEVPEAHDIFKRCGQVFEQTYTRFLDLERAEAQAREAKIEMALEKVRSRTMAMQKSDELQDAAQVLFNEVRGLGIPSWSCGYNILSDDKKSAECWMSSEGALQKPFTLHYEKEKSFIEQYHFFKSKKNFLVQEQKGRDLVEAYEYMKTIPEIGEIIVDLEESGISLPTHQFNHLCKFNKGYLLFITYEPVPEAHELFVRFTKVFEQTYTRFLDLQKAEAQAREAQIEAGLERVRSKTMAMHNSQDVGNTVASLFDELVALGLEKSARCGIGILDESDTMELWTASTNDKGELVLAIGHLNMTLHPLLKGVKKTWRSKKQSFTYELQGEDLINYFSSLNDYPDYNFYIDVKTLTDKIIHNSFYFTDGLIYCFTANSISEDLAKVVKRFAGVFGQTYKRYLDLRKAEAQAREAKIETSLEKVRSRTMGMQSSEELPEVANLLFLEVQGLGIPAWSCGYCILLEDRKSSTCIMSSEGTLQKPFFLPHYGEVSFEEWNSFVQGDQTFFTQELGGNAIESHYNFMKSLPQSTPVFKDIEDAGLSLPTHQINHLCKFNHGFLLFITYEQVPDAHDIFKRFTKVFDQTYTRFLDLQKAEAQAREAVKQSSLDRIRGEIASMRTTKDLERITPLIWKELTTLNIPFIRCGVFIMDESLQQIHTFLSTPEGKAIAAFHLPYNAPGRTREILTNWMHKQVYIEHWEETAFSELGDLLVQQGAMPSKDGYLKTVPQGGIYLHCMPFMQGMLYVGNTIKLNEDEIQLIQSVANAFATAYARYEDFNKLEAAKQQVDKTLDDLKQTQKQLIQSEKMASLGELTAGIAHEIQNPLNFVNNFSEVSKELLEEMMEELKKGDTEEVKALTKDIIENLEKITHHGKRADSIVKGMLQHSRSSTGIKESTDINVLADEYLRLAYHGLRAKDKSFNATMTTDFDKSVGKIDVIAQDIGRVVLNLITNAFYAVTEKKKQLKKEGLEEGYEPTVSVSTKKSGNTVEIRVEDNGNGIPKKLIDKIFQPFFTTKPTGEGTGLGLSLSYDIIQAHKGELKVNTEKDKGTVFTIQLPINGKTK